MLVGQQFYIKKPIALIGFMGSGKSSVAKLLSEQTGIEFVDTDKLVVQRCKQTISEIINSRGESAFRKIEADILDEVTRDKKIIVATGGGCVESAVSRGALKNCFVVWLNVSSKTAADRIIDFSSRPMFKDIENAENVLAQRNNRYEKCSNVEIDTDGKKLDDVVQEVKRVLIRKGILQQ
ncbi:MAG: shikimate kinase [Coriobacteriia bacterium]|nr:shikimate kinase [Coriobacteriia bacterium]